MTIDNYNPSTSLSQYYPSRSTNNSARLWSIEKALHDFAAIGIIDFFEGVASDPTGLAGYSEKKLWLKLPAAGVTTVPGTVRRWNGSSPTSSLSNWPVMSREQFYNYITQDLTGLPGGATWINVQDYGAVGDAATDDYASIQAVIDGAADGSLIYFPRSTYKVSDALKLGGTSNNKNKLVLVGEGDGTVIQLANGVAKNVLEVTFGTGHRVNNLKVRGNLGTVTTPGTDISFRHYNGLYVGGHSGTAVTDFSAMGVTAENAAYCGFMIGSGPVEVANIGDGVNGVQLTGCRSSANVNGLAGGMQINCTYNGCFFEDNEIYGALTDKESVGVTYSGCAFDNASPGATAFNLFLYNCDVVSVTGCSFVGSHYSVVLDNDARNTTITGCVMRGATFSGVVCQNSRYVIVSSNAITDMGNHGVDVRTNVNRITVSNNNISDCGYSGIHFDDGFFLSAIGNTIELCGRHGVHLEGSSNCTVVSNTCASNGTSGTGYDGIRLDDADGNLVQSNLCIDVQVSKTQEYGVRSTGTTEGTVLQFNRLGGNLTGTFLLADASFISDLNGDRLISGSLVVSGPLTGTEVRASGDTGGAASSIALTSTSNVTANSSGVGTIKFKGTTSRDSAGFAKVYVGTTAYYVPIFTAITG